MGRGRAKAKQTRVARRLKYTNHGVDLERLREELAADDDSYRNDEPEDHTDSLSES